MSVFSAHDLVITRDCAHPGCVREANHGRMLCDEHRDSDWTGHGRVRGLTPEQQEILEWIRAFGAEHGRAPFQTEVKPHGAPFTLGRVRTLFGNHGNACQEAGFPRPIAGARPTTPRGKK